jgi:hypothetical protein
MAAYWPLTPPAVGVVAGAVPVPPPGWPVPVAFELPAAPAVPVAVTPVLLLPVAVLSVVPVDEQAARLSASTAPRSAC